jgi:hypothetical protein
MRLPSTICPGTHGHSEPPKTRHVGDGLGIVRIGDGRRGTRAFKGGSGASTGGR